MAERQKRQQQIAPADAAAANGKERRSPLPGDRGDRGSKVTNSPQPARPPPARQINGHTQPAGPALPHTPPNTSGGHGLGRDVQIRGTSAQVNEQACSFLFCLLGFCWFSSPNRKPDKPEPGGGRGAVTWMVLLLRASCPSQVLGYPSPCAPLIMGVGS